MFKLFTGYFLVNQQACDIYLKLKRRKYFKDGFCNPNSIFGCFLLDRKNKAETIRKKDVTLENKRSELAWNIIIQSGMTGRPRKLLLLRHFMTPLKKHMNQVLLGERTVWTRSRIQKSRSLRWREEKTLCKEFEEESGYASYRVVQSAKTANAEEIIKRNALALSGSVRFYFLLITTS